MGHTQRDGRAGQSGAWGPGALSLAAHDVRRFKSKHPSCMTGHSTHVTLDGQRGWATVAWAGEGKQGPGRAGPENVGGAQCGGVQTLALPLHS